MLIAHGVDGSSTNATRTRPILSVCAIASEPLFKAMIVLFNLCLHHYTPAVTAAVL